MNNIDDILFKLEQIERSNGLIGLFMFLAIVLVVFLAITYLKKSVSKSAEVFYNQKIETFKNELLTNLSQNSLDRFSDNSLRNIKEHEKIKLNLDLRQFERKSLLEYYNKYVEFVFDTLKIRESEIHDLDLFTNRKNLIEDEATRLIKYSKRYTVISSFKPINILIDALQELNTSFAQQVRADMLIYEQALSEIEMRNKFLKEGSTESIDLLETSDSFMKKMNDFWVKYLKDYSEYKSETATISENLVNTLYKI